MIKVDNTIKTIPKSLIKRGVTEFEKIKKDLEEKGKIDTDINAYRQQDVKKALTKVFNRKCAYCEQKFDSVSPGAVEHFRPKGRNKKMYKEPPEDYIGYYWLAAKWENLLLSCTDCNSVRSHPVKGKDEEISIGKQDKFPIEDEKYRCKHHDDNIEKEKDYVLLVNPCTEDPEKFFEFTGEGEIKAKEGLQGKELKRSETSMEVYALYRGELVEARGEYYTKSIKEVILEIIALRKALDDIPAASKIAISTLNEEINKKIRTLIDLGKPDQRFSAMAKQLVAEQLRIHLNIETNTFNNPLGAGIR